LSEKKAIPNSEGEKTEEKYKKTKTSREGSRGEGRVFLVTINTRAPHHQAPVIIRHRERKVRKRRREGIKKKERAPRKGVDGVCSPPP